MSVHTTADLSLARSDTATSVAAAAPDRHVNNDRMIGIDAARGLAMVLVCLSHIRYHVVNWPDLYIALTYVTRIATPTFLLLSGFVAAYVLSSGARRSRLTLVDRGIFVLFVGHLLLNLAELRVVSVEAWLWQRVTVTDAIAVCLIATWLFGGWSWRALGLVGVSLALVSWIVALSWMPATHITQALGAILFNVQSEATHLTDAAVMPYLGIFLIGMSLSRWSEALLKARAFDRVARRLLWVAFGAIVCVAIGIAVWHFGKHVWTAMLGTSDAIESVRQTFDPRSKLPPSPAYLLFYGGTGLLMAAACLACRPTALMKPIVTWAATLGRASLMCFILQDWLLILAPALLKFEYLNSLTFWSFYFVAALAVLHVAATRWDRARANRWLTVGLKRFA